MSGEFADAALLIPARHLTSVEKLVNRDCAAQWRAHARADA
jgi:hypothetical protein